MSHAHAPDPGRLVRLLWSPSTAVGRSGLTVGSLVQAATGLADTQGLGALSMRRLADEAGVGAMTLYSYVPGRAELLELMLDSVADEVYAGRPKPRAKRSMPSAVRHVADCNWRHAMSHPWIVDIAPGRPVIGPGECRKYELELEPLDGIGLTDHEMDALLTTVLSLVAATSRWQINLGRVRTASNLTDEQWWQASAPLLARTMQGLDLPIASRVGTAVASAGDPRGTLDHGVAALLDSAVATLERRST